ncbi:hypothetical protein R6Q59_032652, partial [Mikania micrantha]
ALCILSVVAGALWPTSFPVDLCSGIAITLQGLWFYQTTFALYEPSMPVGCKLEMMEIKCSSHVHEVHGQLLANLQMFGLVFLILVGVVGVQESSAKDDRNAEASGDIIILFSNARMTKMQNMSNIKMRVASFSIDSCLKLMHHQEWYKSINEATYIR